MKELNKISILECYEEKEQENHAKEIEKILDKIFGAKNYDCIFEIEYTDEYHKNNRDKYVDTREFHDISDILDGLDFKNGMDAYLHDGKLVFLVHGQGYEYQGENYLVEARVTINAFDKYGYQVDLEKFFKMKEKRLDEQSR